MYNTVCLVQVEDGDVTSQAREANLFSTAPAQLLQHNACFFKSRFKTNVSL